MQCPHCNNTLELINTNLPLFISPLDYKHSTELITKTACCNKIINITITVSSKEYETTIKNKGDWGQYSTTGN